MDLDMFLGAGLLLTTGIAGASIAFASHLARKLRIYRSAREADLLGSVRVAREIADLTAENDRLREELARWRPVRGPKGHFLKPEAGAAIAG